MWGYSVNKWASEELLMKLAANSNCNYTVIRPCVTYDDTPYSFMVFLLNTVITGHWLRVY